MHGLSWIELAGMAWLAPAVIVMALLAGFVAVESARARLVRHRREAAVARPPRTPARDSALPSH